LSKQLDQRAELINYNLRKSSILLTFGYDKLSNCISLLTEEIGELNRQLKLTKNYSDTNFEIEISSIQKKNLKLLSKLKGELAIKSAYIFSNLTNDLISLTDRFFTKKFKSLS
jgi:hypothetical protein